MSLRRVGTGFGDISLSLLRRFVLRSWVRRRMRVRIVWPDGRVDVLK
jgi:hypothetical protein